MRRVTKSILYAVPIEKTIALMDGDRVFVVANPGDFGIFDEEGAFKQIISEREYRERWLTVG